MKSSHVDYEHEMYKQIAAFCAHSCSCVCLEGSRAGSLASHPSWEHSLQGGGGSDASAMKLVLWLRGLWVWNALVGFLWWM